MDNDWKVISRVQLIRFPSMNNHLRSAEYVTITTSMSKGKDYLSYASSPLEEYEIFHVFTGGYLKCGREKLIKVERNEHVYHRRNMIFEKIQFSTLLTATTFVIVQQDSISGLTIPRSE